MADILPSLLAMGLGMGLVFSSSIFGATLGVRPSDAGVASATVTASQQVGGSVGTSLLSTLAASAATSYAHSHIGSVTPPAGALRLATDSSPTRRSTAIRLGSGWPR